MRISHLAAGAPELDKLQDALDVSLPSGTTGLATYSKDGELAAVVAILPKNSGNITLHMTAWKSYWATEEFVRTFFRLVFLHYGATRVTVFAHTNLRVIRLVKRLGFKLEGAMEGYDFGTLYVFGMKVGDCKWVG